MIESAEDVAAAEGLRPAHHHAQRPGLVVDMSDLRAMAMLALVLTLDDSEVFSRIDE